MKSELNEMLRLTAGAQNRRTPTGIPRVWMVRGEIPEHQLSGVYEPMINLILQGGKTLTLGEQLYRFDPASYFVMSIDMPATGKVQAAGPGAPYVAVCLSLEPERLAALLNDVPAQAYGSAAGRGYSVCQMTPQLMDAWLRMLRLMEQPLDIPALAPVYEREIIYRVLQGPQGWLLRDIATPDSALARVHLAIQRIRRDYQLAIDVDQLAASAAMSKASFHRHFKAITSMTPIQYQKSLRLLQARQLLLAEAVTVTQVAYDVGYQSASQFNREYARMFGLPPARDVAALREKWR